MYDKTAIELAKTKEVEAKLKEDFERSQFDLEMCRERFDKCQVRDLFKTLLCWNKYLARVPHTIVVQRYFRFSTERSCCILKSWESCFLSLRIFFPPLMSCYDPPVVRFTKWLSCSWSTGWTNPPDFWICHHSVNHKLEVAQDISRTSGGAEESVFRKGKGSGKTIEVWASGTFLRQRTAKTKLLWNLAKRVFRDRAFPPRHLSLTLIHSGGGRRNIFHLFYIFWEFHNYIDLLHI